MSTEDVKKSNATVLFEGLELPLMEEGAIFSTITPVIESDQLERGADEAQNEWGVSDEILIKGTLGEGGMGIVYNGLQALPEREVAVKRLKSRRRRMIKGLLDEAMVMGKLSHPNIPPVHQVRLDENSHPEVVMQKIEGKTFQAILAGRPQKKDDLRSSLHVLIQVCHAVEFAHSLGILHRDLKPENIMVGSFNQVYLMDWGLAVDMKHPKKSRQGIAGTPAYMAPEMLKGDPAILTPASDVYLFGAILHEILTGKARHLEKTVQASLQLVQKSLPYDFDDETPKMLADLCNQSCRKKASERPQTVLEFRSRLEEFFEHWEVIKIIDHGYEKLQQYSDLWNEECQKSEVNYFLLHQASQQSQFLFEQALELWPESEEAKDGLTSLLEIMIEQALQTKEYQRAQILFENCPKNSTKLDELHLRLEKERAFEQHRQEKLQEIEKEFDPSLTYSPRFLLQRIILFSLTIPISAVLYLQLFVGDIVSTAEHAFYMLVVVSIPILTSVLIMYKRLTVNFLGKQATHTILSVTIAIACSRYACWMFDVNISLVAMIDIILTGMMMFNSAPAMKNGPQLGIFCLVMALVSFLIPEESIHILNVVILSVGIVIFYEWRQTKFLEEDDSF